MALRGWLEKQQEELGKVTLSGTWVEFSCHTSLTFPLFTTGTPQYKQALGERENRSRSGSVCCREGFCKHSKFAVIAVKQIKKSFPCSYFYYRDFFFNRAHRISSLVIQGLKGKRKEAYVQPYLDGYVIKKVK